MRALPALHERASSSSIRQRPMWWLAATTPGRMPSVRHAEITKCPILVLTRTRPLSSMPSASASFGWIQSGWRWLISLSHFELPDRVWMSVGMRNVGSRMRSVPAMSRSSQCTWDGIHFGVAYSGQPQSASVSEYSSSFFDGVGKPSLSSPSISTAGEPSPSLASWRSSRVSSEPSHVPGVPGLRYTPSPSLMQPSTDAGSTGRS